MVTDRRTEDPTVVRRDDADPTVVQSERDDDDTEPLVWPR
jgi:hypothetical protein